MAVEYVRARIGGREVTISRAWADVSGAEVIDAPAVDESGRPLPTSGRGGRRPKPKTTVAKKAAAKKAATARAGAEVVPRTDGAKQVNSK